MLTILLWPSEATPSVPRVILSPDPEFSAVWGVRGEGGVNTR
jgi:hypothetical protein